MLPDFSFYSNYLTQPMSWIFFILGATIGSFLNVCILRIPQKTLFQNTRSACPYCSKVIPIWLNLPIFSWFYLRGKANCCGKKISSQYPIVECITGFFTVIAYWHSPFLELSSGQLHYDPDQFIRWAHLTLLTYLMIICSVIDINLQIIPDVISLSLIAVSPLIALVHPELSLIDSCLGILAGGASLYALAWLYYLVRKEIGLGMGDVKLLAGLGGWLGYQAILPTIFLGSILGSLVGILFILFQKGSLKTAIPFGPFLCISSWIHLAFSNKLKDIALFSPFGF